MRNIPIGITTNTNNTEKVATTITAIAVVLVAPVVLGVAVEVIEIDGTVDDKTLSLALYSCFNDFSHCILTTQYMHKKTEIQSLEVPSSIMCK